MHESVMNFLRGWISTTEIAGKTVLEVGSQNVNGTPRTVIEPEGPDQYIGVDSGPGEGVDVVLDASHLVQYFGQVRFDVVISTEMLEHAQDWRRAVWSMKEVLKPGGLLVVTTRGPGFPYHGFPHDYWRFTTQDFLKIFADFQILHLSNDSDPKSPGVFLKARKPPAVDLDAIEVGKAPANL